MGKRTKFPSKVGIISAIVVIVGGFLVQQYVFNEDGDAKTHSIFENVNDQPGHVGDEATEEVSEEQETSAEASHVQTAAQKAEEEEGESEGLSVRLDENLEQPAPILQEVLIVKKQFVVSYNLNTNCPNYVAWNLTKNRVNGSAKRSDTFMGDPLIGAGSRVETTDYVGSGYDRGHMCPAGDNKNDEEAMQQSFFMTNICPQNHNLNAGDWKELEEQCRQWVKDYTNLYIVCGPIFDSKKPKTIGKKGSGAQKIAVPDRFFKVVLMMGRTPKAIGFIYPNSATNKDMREYCVSVDKVEKITGYDFYPRLDDAIENKVEAECNPGAWGI